MAYIVLAVEQLVLDVGHRELELAEAQLVGRSFCARPHQELGVATVQAITI